MQLRHSDTPTERHRAVSFRRAAARAGMVRVQGFHSSTSASMRLAYPRVSDVHPCRFTFADNLGFNQRHAARVVDWIRQTYPYWNASGGSDHILWWPGDQGAAKYSPYPAGQTPDCCCPGIKRV